MCLQIWSSLFTGVAIADRTAHYVDQLFAPLSSEEFPFHLDVPALHAMLQQPLHPVPVFSMHAYTELDSLCPGLGQLRQDEHAFKLVARLVDALSVAWPGPLSKAELNYTHFWDELGFRLPEWAERYINFQQHVHR